MTGHNDIERSYEVRVSEALGVAWREASLALPRARRRVELRRSPPCLEFTAVRWSRVESRVRV